MINDFLRVGSIAWRLRNYGTIASLKYLWAERLRSSRKKKFKGSEINPLAPVPVLLNSESPELRESFRSLDKILPVILLETENLKSINHIEKLPQQDSTINRLIALDFALRQRNIDIAIESGTQNGVSARFIDLTAHLNGHCIEIHTFDVKATKTYSFSSIVHPYVLKARSRKEFKKLTSALCSGQKSLFFHDSDHSAENMKFEFNWSWKNLKCSVLVSDDVDSNWEFQNFVNGLKKTDEAYLIDCDGGSRAGVILRGSSRKHP